MPFDPANAVPVGSFDPARAEPVTPPTSIGDTLVDVGSSAATGLVKGGASMLDAASGAANLPSIVSPDLTDRREESLKNPNVVISPFVGGGSGHDVIDFISNLVGGLHKPSTPAGNLTERVAEFAPAAVTGSGGLINRAARVALPAIGADIGKEYGPGGELAGALAGGFTTAAGEFGINAAREASAIRMMAPGDRAMAVLEQRLEKDRMTPAHATTAVEHLGAEGKPVTVMDVGGPATARLARTVATLPGQGSGDLVDFLGQRQADQGARIVSDIKGKLGDGSGLSELVDHLSADQENNASPLYKGAFKANQNVASPEIDQILETPAGKVALKSAAAKMRNDRTLAGVPDAELRDQAYDTGQYTPGSGGIASGLKMRTLDYVKRSLDDQIGAAQRAGENDNVRILTGMKNSLVKELDEADVTARAGPNSTKPEGGLYAQARRAYAEPAQIKDAIEAGRNFTSVADPDELAGIVRKIPEAQRPYFQIGAARKLTDLINSVSVRRDAVARVFGSPTMRAQIDVVFGPGATEDFAKAMTTERGMSSTNRFVTGNSTTANKLADIEDTAHWVERGMVGFAQGGRRGAMNAIANLPERVKAAFNQMDEPTRDALAKLLMARAGNTGIINSTPRPVNNVPVPLPRGSFLGALAAGEFPLDQTNSKTH